MPLISLNKPLRPRRACIGAYGINVLNRRPHCPTALAEMQGTLRSEVSRITPSPISPLLQSAAICIIGPPCSGQTFHLSFLPLYQSPCISSAPRSDIPSRLTHRI